MGTRTPTLIALLITMAYGVGFAFFEDVPRAYSVGGALVVTAAWVISSMLHNRSRS